jgi:hypothetical protein
LAQREWAIHREDADTVAIIDSELRNMGVPPPANDNKPHS